MPPFSWRPRSRRRCCQARERGRVASREMGDGARAGSNQTQRAAGRLRSGLAQPNIHPPAHGLNGKSRAFAAAIGPIRDREPWRSAHLPARGLPNNSRNPISRTSNAKTRASSPRQALHVSNSAPHPTWCEMRASAAAPARTRGDRDWRQLGRAALYCARRPRSVVGCHGARGVSRAAVRTRPIRLD